MGFADKYLRKHQFIRLNISRVPPQKELLKYIVIIPAFSEKEIVNTLRSLQNTLRPSSLIEVLILTNYASGASREIKQKNQHQHNELCNWAATHNSSDLYFVPLISTDLPDKHAGAGLARKILMDTACQRFQELGIENGIICSLDADTLVPENYFIELEKCSGKKDKQCFIFNFAHPISGDEYPAEIYNAIILYEMHLRYYKHILKAIGFPFYHYTIGSCFAVTADMYMQAGGMSRRKGGEDFYFLHKVFPNTNTVFISSAKLFPSPRASWRVPFGTGPAIRKILDSPHQNLKTYNNQSFLDLESFLQLIPTLWDLNHEEINNRITELPNSVSSFLSKNKVIEKIEEVKSNSASRKAFIKRFYHWFDAFKVIKYLNETRDMFYEDLDIIQAANQLLNTNECNAANLLYLLRDKDE